MSGETVKKIPLVLATRNKDKIAEMRRALEDDAYFVRTLSEFKGTTEVVEDGKTIQENANTRG